MNVIEKYDWVTRIKAWTVAVTTACSAEDLIRIYGGDPAEPVGNLTFAEVDHLVRTLWNDQSENGFCVQILEGDGWVAAIENMGYSGSIPEIARRCTAGGGWFFSVYWNIHESGMVTRAVDGAIAARVDPLAQIAHALLSRDRRPERAIGIAMDVAQAWKMSMAHLEQQTGIVVDESWLHTPLPTYRIPDPDCLYREATGAEHP